MHLTARRGPTEEVLTRMNARTTPRVTPGDSASADAFLRATDVVDWTAPEILALARRLSTEANGDPGAVARACFEWVRDQVLHTVDAGREEVTCDASDAIAVGTGFCYAKSHLLVALLRANGIRSGFCYQRLTGDDSGERFVLHGLAAVDLGDGAWYRIDPRGNKPGVDAQFTPPVERLAFPIVTDGEILFPKVYPDPLPVVVRALRGHQSASVLREHLPDPVTETELEA
jgi:transglutaminase-like putative cysteine protease